MNGVEVEEEVFAGAFSFVFFYFFEEWVWLGVSVSVRLRLGEAVEVGGELLFRVLVVRVWWVDVVVVGIHRGL